ncbi:MAG: hypothetical protein EZS28_026190 [Streblomastix strix]|uniref:Uncharacterized protein n=1 Tax=Streblomastix strix TaxID=222440 RepID=A0A5J4V765_9EUKA|nr:MAG: hypothetical protein EZS28_026190 [Streblomastix strix]
MQQSQSLSIHTDQSLHSSSSHIFPSFIFEEIWKRVISPIFDMIKIQCIELEECYINDKENRIQIEIKEFDAVNDDEDQDEDETELLKDNIDYNSLLDKQKQNEMSFFVEKDNPVNLQNYNNFALNYAQYYSYQNSNNNNNNKEIQSLMSNSWREKEKEKERRKEFTKFMREMLEKNGKCRCSQRGVNILVKQQEREKEWKEMKEKEKEQDIIGIENEKDKQTKKQTIKKKSNQKQKQLKQQQQQQQTKQQPIQLTPQEEREKKIESVLWLNGKEVVLSSPKEQWEYRSRKGMKLTDKEKEKEKQKEKDKEQKEKEKEKEQIQSDGKKEDQSNSSIIQKISSSSSIASLVQQYSFHNSIYHVTSNINYNMWINNEQLNYWEKEREKGNQGVLIEGRKKINEFIKKKENQKKKKQQQNNDLDQLLQNPNNFNLQEPFSWSNNEIIYKLNQLLQLWLDYSDKLCLEGEYEWKFYWREEQLQEDTEQQQEDEEQEQEYEQLQFISHIRYQSIQINKIPRIVCECEQDKNGYNEENKEIIKEREDIEKFKEEMKKKLKEKRKDKEKDKDKNKDLSIQVSKSPQLQNSNQPTSPPLLSTQGSLHSDLQQQLTEQQSPIIPPQPTTPEQEITSFSSQISLLALIPPYQHLSSPSSLCICSHEQMCQRKKEREMIIAKIKKDIVLKLKEKEKNKEKKQNKDKSINLDKQIDQDKSSDDFSSEPAYLIDYMQDDNNNNNEEEQNIKFDYHKILPSYSVQQHQQLTFYLPQFQSLYLNTVSIDNILDLFVDCAAHGREVDKVMEEFLISQFLRTTMMLIRM